MVDSSSSQEKVISAAELNDVLRRAHDEVWKKLAIRPQRYRRSVRKEQELLEDGWRIYYLSDGVLDLAQRLRSLSSLTSLDLRANGIGDAGAASLSSLSSLTSLDLSDNGSAFVVVAFEPDFARSA